jgi:hypothetical protein
MGKSAKEKQVETADASKTDKQFKITTVVSIGAIIVAILLSGVGAFLGVYIPNYYKTQTTAKMIYDDIDRQNWTLHDLSQLIIQHPNTPPYIITSIYPDDGIYYSSRSDIALLDDKIARNITIFYTDMQYAEKYRQAMNAAIMTDTPLNRSIILSLSYDQYKSAIIEANEMRPHLLDEMEKTFSIPKNFPNRFNYY